MGVGQLCGVQGTTIAPPSMLKVSLVLAGSPVVSRGQILFLKELWWRAGSLSLIS